MDKKQRTIRLVDLVYGWLSFAKTADLVSEEDIDALFHHFTGYLQGVACGGELMPDEVAKFVKVTVEI